jgi:hypothetical protein
LAWTEFYPNLTRFFAKSARDENPLRAQPGMAPASENFSPRFSTVQGNPKGLLSLREIWNFQKDL